MKIIKLVIVLLFIISSSLSAQENTVKDQFQKLYKQSNNYQVYKVVKKEAFLKLQKNTLDSISKIKKVSSEKDATISKHVNTITSLESNINKLNTDLSTAQSKVDNISLFGILLKKSTYNTILWSIIGLLLAFLLFFIYKFNRSNLITSEAKTSLTDVEQEFEQFRKKTLEKEQKLRRQLQDEINKQRGV